MQLLLARHPSDLQARHPIIVTELLDLVRSGTVEAVSTMISMLSDLHVHGRNSRYLRHLTGSSIWELKSQSRGGEKGGSRVYLFLTERNEAAIVNREVKDSDKASTQKLKVVLEVIAGYKAGVPVFEDPARKNAR